VSKATYKIPLVGGMRHGQVVTSERPFEYHEVISTPPEPVIHYTTDTPLPELPPMIPLVKEVYKLERFRKPTEDGFIEKWRYVLDDHRADERRYTALKGIEW